MKNKSNRITAILTAVGIILIAAAVLLTISQQIGQKFTAESNRRIVDSMLLLMPEVHTAVTDDRVDMSMPMLEIDCDNFVGIIEIPLFNKQLPICGNLNKNKLTSFPCRYHGSLYDGSLIICGSDTNGQFDFMKNISIGDSVFVTDMTGGRYYFKVEWIENVKDVSADHLLSYTADMILFSRNSYSLDYSVVLCTMQTHGFTENIQ